jgi:hypothetical protein
VRALAHFYPSVEVFSLFDTRVGWALFAGGWLGTHLRGDVGGWDPEGPDFGGLWGFGVTFQRNRIVAELDARFSHGEVEFWSQGPTRDERQLVLSVGYRMR